MQCDICGFDKKVEKHHIVKYLEFGSDNESNLIHLCPNHHWIADFGEEEDKKLLLNEIKNKLNKIGQTDYCKKNYYEKLIRALLEERFHLENGFTDEEWQDKKNSFEFNFLKKIFLSRPGSMNYTMKNSFIDKGEIVYLIRLLKKKLSKIEHSQALILRNESPNSSSKTEMSNI